MMTADFTLTKDTAARRLWTWREWEIADSAGGIAPAEGQLSLFAAEGGAV